MLFFFGHVTNQVSFQCLQFAWKRPSTNQQAKRKNNYRKSKCFHVYGQKQPVANLSVVDFRSQLRKHTIAQVKYVTFNFSFRIQFYFRFQEILKAIVRKKYQFCCVFSSHNPRKSRQATLDRERSTLCHSFINLTQLIGDIKQM